MQLVEHLEIRMEEDRAELEEIGRRLKLAVQNAGGNARVAEVSGVPLSTLNSYIAGKADPKVTKLARIAEACRTSLEAILGRKLVVASAENETLPGMVMVPQLDVRASAGPGLISQLEQLQPVSQFGVAEAWLHSLGVSPGNAEFLAAQGDSMYPTIQDGDLMLINRGYGRVINGKIYVLVVGGNVLVKRLQILISGAMMLISDNPAYQPETVRAADVEAGMVQGRVTWYGRPI